MQNKKRLINILSIVYAILGLILVAFIIIYSSFRTKAEYSFPQSLDITDEQNNVIVYDDNPSSIYLKIGGYGVFNDSISDQAFNQYGLWVYIPNYEYFNYIGNTGYSRIELVTTSSNNVVASKEFIALDYNRPNINGWYFINSSTHIYQDPMTDLFIRIIIYLDTGYNESTLVNLIYDNIYVQYGNNIPDPTIIDYNEMDAYYQGYNQGQLDAWNNGFIELDDTLSASYMSGYLIGYDIAADEIFDDYFDNGFGVNDNLSFSYQNGYNAGIIVGESNVNAQINIFRDILPSAIGGIWAVVANFLSFEVLGINAWMVLSLFASIAILILVLKLVT